MTSKADVVAVVVAACNCITDQVPVGMQDAKCGPVRQWSCSTLKEGVSLLSTKAMAHGAADDLRAKIEVLMFHLSSLYLFLLLFKPAPGQNQHGYELHN